MKQQIRNFRAQLASEAYLISPSLKGDYGILLKATNANTTYRISIKRMEFKSTEGNILSITIAAGSARTLKIANT